MRVVTASGVYGDGVFEHRVRSSSCQFRAGSVLTAPITSHPPVPFANATDSRAKSSFRSLASRGFDILQYAHCPQPLIVNSGLYSRMSVSARFASMKSSRSRYDRSEANAFETSTNDPATCRESARLDSVPRSRDFPAQVVSRIRARGGAPIAIPSPA